MEDIIKEISIFKTEEEYRESDAVSYSQIAKFFRGGIVEAREEAKPSEEMKFDLLLGSLMTEGNTIEDRYAVLPDEVPRPAEKAVIEALANEYDRPEITSIPIKEVIGTANNLRYRMNWKTTTRYIKLIKGNSVEFYRWYRANKDKIPITRDFWESALHCKEQIMSHPLVKRIMQDYEIYYRVKIATDLSDIGVGYCKSMLDAVAVDSNHKLLIPVGIKTMGEDECLFEKSVVKWQYWLQALMYSDILRFTLRDNGIYDWQVVNAFYFVVVNREDPKPLIYKFSTDSMARARYPDWMDIGCRLKRYLDNPDRDTPFGVSRSMTVSMDEKLVKDYPFGFKDTNR